MLSLYEILKASKTGIAPDMWTALAGMNWGGKDSGHEVKELTGIPPLSFTADGTPLLDYLISGNMTQTGTPTPQNPIQPNETGDTTGNLFDYNKTDGIIANKYINQSGVMVESNEYYISSPIKVNVGETYTWRFNSNSTSATHTAPTVGFYDSSDNLLSAAQHNAYAKYFSFEVPTNCAYIRASVFIRNNAQQEAMLNFGSTPIPYEPYGYKLPLTSAGQTNNVYLGEVPTTRMIKKLVLTGEESWTYESQFSRFSTFYILPVSFGARATPMYCSHFQVIDDGRVISNVPNNSCYSGSVGSSGVYLKTESYTSVEDFKAYLAQQYASGTPITLWVILATEETGIVNEPLRKIGTYADAVSYEQAGVQIPTLNGQTVVDVETTLIPSEMYIKYQE